MKYRIEAWSIKQLTDLVATESINLRPSYQRNDIWTTAAKKRLLDTIHQGLPLPAFFLHETVEGSKYDMVDGQQRTRTIVGYLNGLLKDEKGKKYSEDANSNIYDYLLAVIVIYDVPVGSGAIRDYYYRVNKYGMKVNRPEQLRSKYLNTPLQNLVESIARSESWGELQLFTQAKIDRLADEDFIAELLTLQKFGISDKKLQVDRFYADPSFSENEATALKAEFNEVIDRIKTLNDHFPLAQTRYKQRNDFYTLYSFIRSLPSLDEGELVQMYEVLTRVGPSISPSREECFTLQEYAINCVSQSHLKSARELRLDFFKALLLNNERRPVASDPASDANHKLADVMRYFHLTNSDLVQVGSYFLMNSEKLPAPPEQIP